MRMGDQGVILKAKNANIIYSNADCTPLAGENTD